MSNREKKLLREWQVEKERAAVEKALRQSSDKEFMLRNAGLASSPLAAALLRKCPKLVCKEYGPGLGLLEKHKHAWMRQLSDWIPRGKGGDSLFISLITHLVAKYPVPKFLYCVFFKGLENHVKLFVHVAQGGSLFKIVGTEMLPVPLTRRLCHRFLSLPADTPGIVKGLRIVQIDSYGGTHSLKNVLLQTALGRTLHSPESEIFWDTAIRWFCDNPMLDTAQVGPLMDYIYHCLAENPDFSMKGRSVVAMLNGMHEWHDTLSKIRRLKGVEFKPAGFEEARWAYKTTDKPARDEWTITEILSSKELAAEGTALRHCVYSYARSIAEGRCSIWSVRKNDERMITVEVNNRTREIWQARGFCNRLPKPFEESVIRRWAALNNLKTVYRIW